MFKVKSPIVMRPIDKLIIHCAATKPSMDIGAKEIRDWHVNDRGWKDIGYHFVIRRDGTLEDGRPINQVGAHVEGHNTGSFGICLVGGINDKGKAESNFTDEQWNTLRKCVMIFKAEYPKGTVHGHNEFSKKDCPSFSVQKWLKAEGL